MLNIYLIKRKHTLRDGGIVPAAIVRAINLQTALGLFQEKFAKRLEGESMESFAVFELLSPTEDIREWEPK